MDKSKQPSINWPVFILLLMAVGVPTAAGITFAEQVTQNPWQALGLALLYESLVMITGFVFKVWQKLESRWVDRVADRVDEIVRATFIRYRRRYLEHLVYRHRVFDVKGLTTQGVFTLELKHVFVELSVAPQALHHVSADPIGQVPKQLRRGRRVIWDYLQSRQMAGQSLAVIGPPGCGKTTLLQHMALTLAAGKKRRRWMNAPYRLPILLFLRNHIQDIQSDVSLVDLVQRNLARWNLQAPAGWFENHLRQGRCLVMLDGLDEVADPKARKQVVGWVERQMVAYARNRFIITSRPHGYGTNPLSGVAVLEVRPFTSDQVQRFVYNWYLANEVMSAQKEDPGVRMVAQEGAEDLLRRLQKSPALLELAVNPLLLTMIATVHRYRSALPQRRVELYNEICDVFLGTRQQAKGLELDLTPAQKKFVLQPLAYHMMCRQQREIPLADARKVITEPLELVSPQYTSADFLKMIENTAGLLLERETGLYGFAHKTFQEYLAANHIQEKQLESELAARIEDPWWEETIRLYAAQVGGSSIIEACLAGDNPSVAALTLAIECVEEAREVKPTLRIRIKTILAKGVEDTDPSRRQVLAEALLNLRLRRLIRITEDKYADTSLIAHAEYQLFLDAQRAYDNYYQPDHWLAYRFPPGQGKMPVVGVRPSDVIAFCDWLTQRESSGWYYRLPKAGELNPAIRDHEIYSETTTGTGYWTTLGEEFELEQALLRSSVVISTDHIKQQVDLDLSRVSAPDLDLAERLALSSALDRTLDRALDFDFELGRKVQRYLDQAQGLSTNFQQAFILARNLKRIIESSLERINKMSTSFGRYEAFFGAVAPVIDLCQNLEQGLNLLDSGVETIPFSRIRQIERNLAHIRAHRHDIQLALAKAKDLRSNTTSISSAEEIKSRLELICKRVGDIVVILDNTRELLRDSTDDFTRDLTRSAERARILGNAISIAHTRVNNRIPSWMLDSGFEDILNLNPDLTRDLYRALRRYQAFIRDPIAGRRPDDWLRLLDFLRWCIRLQSLVIATELLLEPPRWSGRNIAESCVDLYIDFVVLEERIRGNLPAFEGIRIVKERKHGADSRQELKPDQ